jgi:hypothetical protein
MYAPSYPFRVKYGISGNIFRRRREIAESLARAGRKNSRNAPKSRRCWVIFAVPSLAASVWENRLHRIFKAQNKRIEGVNGGTEFFSIFTLPIALVFIAFFLIFEVIVVYCIFCFCVFAFSGAA